MGIIIRSNSFSLQNSNGILKPIIYCCSYENIMDKAVSLSKELTQTLIQIRPKHRTIQIERCFVNIILKLPKDTIIKDFDVLFNPDYKVDVMKMMVNTCKAKPFSIIWPGTFDGTRLVYAEEGFQDYKTYDVSAYDITCIV